MPTVTSIPISSLPNVASKERSTEKITQPHDGFALRRSTVGVTFITCRVHISISHCPCDHKRERCKDNTSTTNQPRQSSRIFRTGLVNANAWGIQCIPISSAMGIVRLIPPSCTAVQIIRSADHRRGIFSYGPIRNARNHLKFLAAFEDFS
jgi:hypothetical protein